MKGNRPQINGQAADPFKGAVFFAPEAVEIGLIDGVATEAQAVEALLQQQNSNNPNRNMSFQNFPKLSKARKAEQISAEELSEINAELQEKKVNAFLVPVSADFESAADFEKFAGQLETLEAENENLTEENAGLKNVSGELLALFGDDAKAEGFNIVEAVQALQKDAKAHREYVAGNGAAGADGGIDPEAGAEGNVDLDSLPHNQKADSMGFSAKTN